MGFFDKLKGGMAFNRMANAYKHAFDSIEEYYCSNDVRNVYKAMWIMKHFVCDSIDKWHWNLYAKIFIPDYQQLGRITVVEANHIAMGKIGTICNCLNEEENAMISRILEGEKLPEVESLVPSSLKDKLLP